MTEAWIPAARARLKRRGEDRPTRVAAQIRALLPAIESAIANGQSQKQICHWLNEEGVRISQKALSVYLRRIRQQGSSRTAVPAAIHPVQPVNPERAPDGQPAPEPSQKPQDPLVNLRERQQNRPGFHYDPDIKPEKLI